MDQSPSHSALTTVASALRGIWAVVRWFAAEVDPLRVIDAWVNEIFRKLDALLLQYQAGQLAPRDGVGAGWSQQTDIRAAADAEPVREGQVVRSRAVWPARSADIIMVECHASGSGPLRAEAVSTWQIPSHSDVVARFGGAWRSFCRSDAVFYESSFENPQKS